MRKNKKQNTQGDKRGDDQLRQVLAEIGVQRLNPCQRGVDQFSGAFGAGIGRAEAQDLIKQAPAQIAFDAHGHGIGTYFTAPGQDCTEKDNQKNKAEKPGNIRQRLPTQENPRYYLAERRSLPDGQQAGQESGQNGCRQGQAAVTSMIQESALHGKSIIKERPGNPGLSFGLFA